MDGSDMAFDYKAVAAGIARSEGMGALLPVVEKELLHYRILSAMQDGGFFGPIVFQGGTSLRLCHGSPRYSEDLDFAGGTGFGVDDLRGLGECVRSSLAGMSPDVQVKVREPVRDEGLVRRWRISIRTAAQRRDLPSQSIKLEVASVPAHEPQTRPVRVNYPSVSAIAGDIILAVESPTEILADKLLSFACSSHIRRRDLWDMCWLSSRADVDASRAFRMATLKAGEYGEVGEWEARAGRLREIPSVLSSDAFLDEMRRFLPARMLVATVESPSWHAYASQAVTGLYRPSGPVWASPYGSPGFGRPMPEPDQSSAVPMRRDGGPALS